MENCGVNIMNLYLIFRDKEAQFINFSDVLPGFDPTARKPHRKVFNVVIATHRLSHLSHWSAPELSTPDHQSVFQEAALLEILDQSCTGAIRR